MSYKKYNKHIQYHIFIYIGNDLRVVPQKILKENIIYDRIFSVIILEKPNRKKNRLQNFDYESNGCYFVTLCTQNRQLLFEIESYNVGNDLRVVPPMQNQIIHKWISESENKFNNIQIDKYVIMPDHLHLIVNITERHTGRSLQDLMRFFKTMTTNEYIKNVKSGNIPPFQNKLWQKSYYDHIIRNQEDYNDTWEYIENNPLNWKIKHNKIQDD